MRGDFLSCPFYWWNHGFSCKKTGKEVNEDTYYKYCRNYDYMDCPIYKHQNPSDGGCYLTTACIKAKNLSDDCYELNTLRSFRDTYMKSFDKGNEDVEYYYLTAPQIVTAINNKKNSNEIFSFIYDGYILPCVEMIEKKNFIGAHIKYKEMVRYLEKEYLL